MSTPKGLSHSDSQELIKTAKAKYGQLKIVASLAGVCDSHIYHILSDNPRHVLSTFAADRLRRHLV